MTINKALECGKEIDMWDFSNVAEDGGLVPAGIYKVAVVDAELKDTKSGTGKIIKTQFKILEGANAGRLIFSNFNIINDNEQAMNIGRAQLKRLMVQAGKENPDTLSSPSELVGLTCMAEVTVAGGKGEYGPSNQVGKFTAIDKEDAPF